MVSLLGAEAGGVLEGGVPAGEPDVPDHVLRLQGVEQQQDRLVRAQQHHKAVHAGQRVLPVRHLRGGAASQAPVVVLHPEVLLLLLVGTQEPEVCTVSRKPGTLKLIKVNLLLLTRVSINGQLLRAESVDELVHRRNNLRDRHRRSWVGAVWPAHRQHASKPVTLQMLKSVATVNDLTCLVLCHRRRR